MSNKGTTAQARRLYLHRKNGGAISLEDMERVVQWLERKDAELDEAKEERDQALAQFDECQNMLNEAKAGVERLTRVVEKVMLADEALGNGQSLTGTIMLADAVSEYRKALKGSDQC